MLLSARKCVKQRVVCHSMLRYLLTILLLCSLCYGQDSTKRKKQVKDTIYLKSDLGKDTIFFKQKEQLAVDKSNDNLKTWLPTATALIVLLVTNLVVLYKIRRDSKESIKKEIIVSRVKIDRERLEKFYDPIYTTLKTNSDIFNSFGPHTFPRDSGHLENEAANVWKLVIRNVIIPNNRKVCDTIKSFSHLINKDDKIDTYVDFIKHAESFEHFINYPNTIHKAFKYPVNIISHVESMRNLQLAQLSATENQLIF